MTFDDYQQSAARTINPALTERERLLDAGAGLAEEAAEVLGLIRKHVFQARELDSARVAEELGDVLWCLAVTARQLGLPLSAIAAGNEAKLRQRHPNGFAQSGERESGQPAPAAPT